MSTQLFTKIKKNPSYLLLYLIVLVPVLTMCYFLALDYSYREEEDIRKNEQMAKVLAENLDSYILNVKATLASVSTLQPLISGDRKNTEEIFHNLIIADNHVSLFWVMDLHGKVIAKYPNSWPDKTNLGFLREVLKDKAVISEPRKGTITGLEIITISTLIKDKNGIVQGVLGASIPLESLGKKLLLQVGNTGYPILVTKKGTFLVHPQRNEINKKITLDDPIFKVILKGGSGTLDIVAPFDGRRKFFSYVPLKHADWILLVIQPLSEFRAQTLKIFTRNGVIIVLTAFIIILAAYYLSLLRKREEEARILQAEKLSAVGQLAAGMAHEIRNPLTSIKGFAQLAAARDEKISAEHLDIIISEVDRIEGIVKETMLLAKPAPVEIKPINIKQLLEEVKAIMEPQTNLAEIKLLLSIEENLPLLVGEPNQLKQVFINLIRNSIEAIKHPKGEIDINVKKLNNNIAITLKDNGSGIPKEVLGKLGNPFVSTKSNGTGLGLMVSYRIIQNHDGKMDVQSVLGQGTTFTIELPITKLQ